MCSQGVFLFGFIFSGKNKDVLTTGVNVRKIIEQTINLILTGFLLSTVVSSVGHSICRFSY